MNYVIKYLSWLSVFSLIIFLAAGPVSSASLAPLQLEDRQLGPSDGASFFMDILQKREDGIRWSHIEMEPERLGISGTVTGPRRVYPGTPSITLRLDSGGRRVSKVLRFQWYCYALVSTRRIDRGERLSPDDLTIKLVPYERSYGRIFSDLSDLQGFRAKRRIRSMQVVSASDVERVSLVERGDRIIVCARAGAVESRIEGVALESGSKGSVIRVRISRYRKDIQALVLEKGLALVR